MEEGELAAIYITQNGLGQMNSGIVQEQWLIFTVGWLFPDKEGCGTKKMVIMHCTGMRVNYFMPVKRKLRYRL